MLEELDAPVAREALVRLPEHGLGEVEPHTEHLVPVNAQQGKQAPVARTQVEDTTRFFGNLLEQDAFALGSMRQRVRAR